MTDVASSAGPGQIPNSDCVGKAASEILNATCGVELTPACDGNMGTDGVIIAVISLVGDVEWSVFLSLPKPTAEAMAAKFAGFEIPFDSSDMGDAIGELANMLAGAVKAKLDQRGVKANISLPSVIRAENIEVLVQKSSTTIRECYDSNLGKLCTGMVAGQSIGFTA